MAPEGWKHAQLGSLSKLITSGSRDWARYYSSQGDLFIRMTNLTRNGISLNLTDVKYVAVNQDSADGKRTKLELGDILISITAELGKIGYIGNELGNAYINQHTALVRIDGKCADSKYIAYLLSSKKMNQTINRLNDAGAKAGLNLSTIKLIPLNMPPLLEQTKIAQILSTWDRAIDVTEKLIENSKAHKKALMQQLLTGKKRFSAFHDNWKEVSIKEMGRTVSGGTPDTTNTDYWNGDVLWVTPTDITSLKSRYINNTKRKITKKGVKESSANPLPVGALLVCTRATIGSLAIAKKEITTNQGFKNLILNDGYDSEFVYYLFDYFKHEFIRYACGSTFLELSKKDFEKRVFYIPEIKEQKKIASVLNTKAKEIYDLSLSLDYLRAEKKALMQQLLTGKRRVKLEATDHFPDVRKMVGLERK